MRAWLAILTVTGACAGADPDIKFERQSATLALAGDTWTEGSTVLVGVPGSFMFPQPLALRLSLIDSNAALDESGAPPQLPVSNATIRTYGTAAADVSTEPTCDALACAAELRITGQGQSMFEIMLSGTDGEETECFYFAIFEDADPAAASEALRADVEAQQTKCRASLLD